MNQKMQQQPSRQSEQHAQQSSRDERTQGRAQSDLHPVEDVIHYVREYTRERPETVAITCFAVGFILGWRLKPW